MITSGGPSATRDGHVDDAADLRWFVFALFFIFGGITSLNDVIIPKLKELFVLSYGRALLVQSAFFAAYFIFSLPAAGIVRRIGYMRSAALGLMTMTVGCVLFIPASAFGTFGLFLFALFVLAAGITIVQVVANPLISMLGSESSAHSRLTFAQGFNALGTTIFPYVGSIYILGRLNAPDTTQLSGSALNAYRAAETQTVVVAYLGLAVALSIVAAVVWGRRHRLREVHARGGNIFHAFTLLKRRRFALGASCIFLYVGAEVALGSLIVNYLEQSNVFSAEPVTAGKYVPLYWGGALIGRFLGSGVLRLISPGKLLASAAVGAVGLILVSANTTGMLSGYALLAIGLANSIMFPTIFSLASEGLGPRAAEGSGIIATAIVGGAVIPPLTGHLADLAGLHFALALPALCYVMIAAFGIHARRPDLTPR